MTNEEVWLQSFCAMRSKESHSIDDAKREAETMLKIFNERFPKPEIVAPPLPPAAYGVPTVGDDLVVHRQAFHDYYSNSPTSNMHDRDSILDELIRVCARAKKAEGFTEIIERAEKAEKELVSTKEELSVVYAAGQDYMEQARQARKAEKELKEHRDQLAKRAVRLSDEKYDKLVEIAGLKEEVVALKDQEPDLTVKILRITLADVSEQLEKTKAELLTTDVQRIAAKVLCIKANERAEKAETELNKLKNIVRLHTDRVDQICKRQDPEVNLVEEIAPEPEVKEEPKTSGAGVLFGMAASALIGAGMAAIGEAGKVSVRVAEPTDIVEAVVEEIAKEVSQ
jgi:hypothetical protein